MPRPRRWTDEQLTEAVATSTTLSEVCRRIGTQPGRFDLLRKHIARIGVDASHLAPARRWTDDQLAEAVTASATLSEVCRRIGVRPGSYDVLRQNIARIGVDASHLPDLTPGGRGWTDDDLRAAVGNAVAVSQVIRALGYQAGGGAHGLILRHVQRLGLDTSHFLGRGWARGRRLRAGSATFGYINMPDAWISEIRVVRRQLRAGARAWGWRLDEVFYENRAGSSEGFERMRTALQRGEGARVVIASFTHFSSGRLEQDLMLQSLENDLDADVVALNEDGVPEHPCGAATD